MTSIFRRPLSAIGPVAIRRLQQIPTLRGLATTTTTTGGDGGVIAKQTTNISYIDRSGEELSVDAEIGKNLMDVAHDNNIELEGNGPWQIHPCTCILRVSHAQLLSTTKTDEGACGGELACSTCHLVFEKEVYDTLPPKTDEEEDMLDLAFELTET